ncbi:EutN/CcmL family microcompartment protein [Opitutus sp. ER46]|uniref:EutN/CcmL family microcompartment protein n=1 Tax=Opitutus sp. ER46 TaxID=2161864 RepID=UPI000D30059F|nr:EutN/CcmL family microcompartment protein [Opitutus sp. ER46]PTX97868.1 ethanolamine utilization protein EutN [Opitutus sp. ER46]
MRIANVIGRVTLSVRHHSLRGERLLVVLPWSAKTGATGKDHEYSIVAYDDLGAAPGDKVALSESTEATRPFDRPTPCDAYVAAILDDIFYQAEDPHAV